jgi:dynamin 1-like protein
VQLVYEELRRIVTEIEMPELQRFQNLRKKLIEVMYSLLNKQLQPTNAMIKNLVKIQDAYINTYHPDFMGGANSIVNVFDVNNYSKHQMQMNQATANRELGDFEDIDVGQDTKKKSGISLLLSQKGEADGAKERGTIFDDGRLKNFNDKEINKYMQHNVKPIHLPEMPSTMRAENQDPGQSSPRSHLETHIIKSLIVSYFDTVRKSMNDMVPKTIMAFLVNKTKNLTQRELVAALYSEGVDLKELLQED